MEYTASETTCAFLPLFDLDEEFNPPTWLFIFLLSNNALALIVIDEVAGKQETNNPAMEINWTLSGGFAALQSGGCVHALTGIGATMHRAPSGNGVRVSFRCNLY